jgi:hypothetical protein
LEDEIVPNARLGMVDRGRLSLGYADRREPEEH